jgi:hypothetical protein
MFCSSLFAEELALQKLDDWNGYAIDHFLMEKDGVISTKRKRISIDSKASIKIDPKRKYIISGSFRRLSGSKDKPVRISFGVIPCNENRERIFNLHINPHIGTETILVRDAAKGDKVIYVKDASKWHKKRWKAVAFDIKPDNSDLPNSKVSSIIRAIKKKGAVWQITFRKGLRRAYSKGIPVRQHFMSNKHFICAAMAAVKELPEKWTKFSGTITGTLPVGKQAYNKFWYGTVSARIRIEAAGNIEFKDISLKDE